MTTYYLQNQMITKLSEQSTMEEQINLSPQKKYTASGENYAQEVYNMASGTILTTGSFFQDQGNTASSYDYLILENTGTTSLVASSKAKIGSVTGVEITASATAGTLDINGSGSFNFTNYYGHAITISDSQKASLQNLLWPVSFSHGLDGTNLDNGAFFEITNSGGSNQGRFNIIKTAVSTNLKMDFTSRKTSALAVAAGYTFDLYVPSTQVIPAGASIVVSDADKYVSDAGSSIDFMGLGVCPTPANASASTLPGGQVKITGVQA